MKVQTLEKVVDDAGPPMIAVDTVEDITCRLHRQRGDFRTLAARGYRRDAGCDKEAYCFKLAQFVYHRIYILCACSFRVENGFGVVEDDEHLLGGKVGMQGCVEQAQVYSIYYSSTLILPVK